MFNSFGPIEIEVVENLKADDGDEAFGLWLPLERKIQIRKGMHRVTAWLTLWHERTHADLQEIGVVISTDQAEAICNAIANQRVLEMQAALAKRAK